MTTRPPRSRAAPPLARLGDLATLRELARLSTRLATTAQRKIATQDRNNGTLDPPR